MVPQRRASSADGCAVECASAGREAASTGSRVRALRDGLPALAGGLDGDAARVDDPQVRAPPASTCDKPARAQQRGELLALVLVDLAAERLDAKTFSRATRT